MTNTQSIQSKIYLALFLFITVGCSDQGVVESAPEIGEAQNGMPVNSNLQNLGGLDVMLLPVTKPITSIDPTSTPAIVDQITAIEVTEPIAIGCDYFTATEIEHDTNGINSINGSQHVPTSDFAIRFNIEIDQFEHIETVVRLTVRVHSWTDYQANTIGSPFVGSYPLEFNGGDKLVVISNGQRRVLKDNVIQNGSGPIEGYGSYHATLSPIKPGDCIRVAIERNDGQLRSTNTVITIPPVISMLSPIEGELYSPEDYMSISWGLTDEIGNTTVGNELKEFSSALLCKDETGEFKRNDRDYDPLNLDSKPTSPQTRKVSELLSNMSPDQVQGDDGNIFSGCKLEFRMSEQTTPDIKVNYDSALLNSKISLPSYFDEFEYHPLLRRTINLY